MSEELNEPTKSMVIAGFEAVSEFQESDEYKELSGCQAAAASAKVCWKAMQKAAPQVQECVERDAKRYRWLRDKASSSEVELLFWMDSIDEMERAIDFAMLTSDAVTDAKD